MIKEIVDFLGFLFIVIAALSISSKLAVRSAKLRLFAFVSYLIACLFLIILGILVEAPWFITQNVFLTGVNIRGIINAVLDIKKTNNE